MAPNSRNAALAILSHLLAAALGSYLWSHRAFLAQTFPTTAVALSNFIISQLQWFETAKPAGIKLHIGLTHIFSSLGIQYALFSKNAFIFLPPNFVKLGIALVSLSLPLTGIGGALRTLAWISTIFSAPITFAYVSMALLYRFHLYSTKATWQAMRGRQPLPLPFLTSSSPSIDPPTSPRSPTKHSKQTHSVLKPTHLAVAALVFMPFFLTLPTTAWYYAFTCVLHIISVVPVELADYIVGSNDKEYSPLGALKRSMVAIGRGNLVGIDRWVKVAVLLRKRRVAAD